MRFISILLVISGLVAAALSLAHDNFGSVGQIKEDLSGMDVCTTALTGFLDNLSNTMPTRDDLKLVLDASIKLDFALAKCSNDTASINSILPLTDASSILSEIEGFERNIIAALSSIQKKRAAFEFLGQITIVRAYLLGLKTRIIALVALFIKICPKDIVPDASALESRILERLQLTIAVYI